MAEHIVHIASDTLPFGGLRESLNLFMSHAQLGVSSFLLPRAEPVHPPEQGEPYAHGPHPGREMKQPALCENRCALQKEKADHRVGRLEYLRDRDRYIDINSPGGVVDRNIDQGQGKHGEHPNPTEPAGSTMR